MEQLLALHTAVLTTLLHIHLSLLPLYLYVTLFALFVGLVHNAIEQPSGKQAFVPGYVLLVLRLTVCAMGLPLWFLGVWVSVVIGAFTRESGGLMGFGVGASEASEASKGVGRLREGAPAVRGGAEVEE